QFLKACQVSGAARVVPALTLCMFGLGGIIDALLNWWVIGNTPLVSGSEILLYLFIGITLAIPEKWRGLARTLALVTFGLALVYVYLQGIWGGLLLLGTTGLVVASFSFAQQKNALQGIAFVLVLFSIAAFIVPDHWLVSRLPSYAHESHID